MMKYLLAAFVLTIPAILHAQGYDAFVAPKNNPGLEAAVPTRVAQIGAILKGEAPPEGVFEPRLGSSQIAVQRAELVEKYGPVATVGGVVSKGDGSFEFAIQFENARSATIHLELDDRPPYLVNYIAIAVPMNDKEAQAFMSEEIDDSGQHSMSERQYAILDRALQLQGFFEGSLEPEEIFSRNFLARVPAADLKAFAAETVQQNGPLFVNNVLDRGENAAKVEILFENGSASAKIEIEEQAPYLISEFRITEFMPGGP